MSYLPRFRLACAAFILVLLLLGNDAAAQLMGISSYVNGTPSAGAFPIVAPASVATLLLDPGEWPGVRRAAFDLQSDIAALTGSTPGISVDTHSTGPHAIFIGTLGKSPLIDGLVKSGKIDPNTITGKWESYFLQVVANPLPGIDGALVIAGSDKRGTIYGIYDLSEQMGVSPWTWWADVPVPHRDSIYIKPGKYEHGEPSVKYRGIFFNDEAPDLTNWVRAKYGNVTPQNNPKITPNNSPANYGHEFYARVFELLLRLHGNYLWPAMWNNAFNEDDPENAKFADMYGIVMGTSHQEPMLRAQKEWDWGPGRQQGNWNYNNQQQRPALENFWREGVKRNKDFESIYTLGLRAENDSGEPIGAPLTEQIVAVQRKILAEEITPDITKVPQLWCLYKEVQGFYEQGLRVPDDITLLWADDNWGNIRRLPTADERKRPGGAGIYYHFDYHGGPRSYQWINTSPISKIYDQMSLAKAYGADRIWIVNVGHFKGYELPTEFFLSLGWDSTKLSPDSLNEYTRQWAAHQFGPDHAAEIADILNAYTRFNGRRKPELLDANTYSLVDYQEAESIVAEYKALTADAQALFDKMPAESRDAFYQLVLFPTLASSQVNELYLAAAKNALYARQGRTSANDYATQTQALFKADADLMTYFNKKFANAKWDHFMDQSHIGYTSWQDPPQNNLNAIRLTQITPAPQPSMAIALDGWADAYPRLATPTAPASAAGPRGRGAPQSPAPAASPAEPTLPIFDAFNQQRRYIDIFNRGTGAFDFTATPSDPWILLSATTGKVEKELRLWITIDWSQAPKETTTGTITIKSPAGPDQIVKLQTFNPTAISRETLDGFIESEQFISIEAEHFSQNIPIGQTRWTRIDDYGRTLSGMTIHPPTAPSITTPTPQTSPCLTYKTYITTPPAGPLLVHSYLAPSLNFAPGRGVRFAISFDDQPPQVITAIRENSSAQNGNADWERTVRDSIRIVTSSYTLATPGYHTFKFWMVDPGIVLEKIVIDCGGAGGWGGGVKPSYLGPPESYHRLPPAPNN